MELKINQELKALIPPLTGDEYRLLEESIIDEGCRDKIITWDDTIVDGHNRYEICTKHGVPFQTEDRDFESMDAVKVWMIDNQKGRRNLTDGWKWELAQARKAILAEKHKQERKERYVSNLDTHPAEKQSESGRTQKEIASELGWSTGKVAMADKVWKQAKPEVKEKIKTGEVSFNQAYTDIKKEEKEEKKREARKESIKKFEIASKKYKDNDINIYFEDFKKGCDRIEDSSVDAIITDPPYPVEFMHLWQDMFKIADRILKPSAFLVTYANHQNLDKIFQLPNPLKYYWIFKLDFTAKPIAMGRNLIATWKPVLVYQKKPFRKIEETIEDQIKETKKFEYSERDLHELNWGQSLGKFEYIIEKFTQPGDIIVDPFTGTGTTLVAAKNTKRRCIGFEVERDKYEKLIKGRIMEGK